MPIVFLSGNAAEFIICLAALREGLHKMVMASLAGAIIGNILLVMGVSMLLGGRKWGVQRYDIAITRSLSAMLTLSVISMIMRLSEDDQLRADLIQALMCHGSVPIDALERRYDIEFADYFSEALRKLKPLAEDGLVRIERHRIVATTRGRLLLRNIAMCFDRYLDSPSPVAAPRFSRAI